MQPGVRQTTSEALERIGRHEEDDLPKQTESNENIDFRIPTLLFRDRQVVMNVLPISTHYHHAQAFVRSR